MANENPQSDFVRGPLLLIVMLLIIILTLAAFLILRPRGPDARNATSPSVTVST